MHQTNVENCDAHLVQLQLPPFGIPQDLLCHHLCRCSRERYIHTLSGTLCELSRESPCSLRESHVLHVLHRPIRYFCPRFQRTLKGNNAHLRADDACVQNVNKLARHLPVIKLTECLLEDAKNQGSMGQYEGLLERLKKQVQATSSVKTYPHAMVLLIFWASHLGILTAHSSHHCPQLRENATRHQEGPKIAKSYSKEGFHNSLK